jgi:hypothetical protein
MHGRAHTDVGDDTSHNHGGNSALAQEEIEISAKERAVAAFGHDNVGGSPMQGVYELRAPGVHETVRNPFLEHSKSTPCCSKANN